METIALSKKNYVDIAVSLEKIKNLEKKIINQIKTSKDKIFLINLLLILLIIL